MVGLHDEKISTDRNPTKAGSNGADLLPLGVNEVIYSVARKAFDANPDLPRALNNYIGSVCDVGDPLIHKTDGMCAAFKDSRAGRVK